MNSTVARLKKSELTRAAIVSDAIQLAEHEGMTAITFGRIADRLRLSKSGVFARTGSLKDLQVAVLEELVRRFFLKLSEQQVFCCASGHKLDALFLTWTRLVRDADKSPLFVRVLSRDEPCLSSDHLGAIARDGVKKWRDILLMACSDALGLNADEQATRVSQLAFEVNAVMIWLISEMRAVDKDHACLNATRAYHHILNKYHISSGVSICDVINSAISDMKSLHLKS